MVELEKVIKSFEECLKTPRCQDCPWESCERADCARAEMPYDLVYAALEWLKAQGTRVMTLEEVKDSIGEAIYFESRGTYMGKIVFPILPALFTPHGLMRYVHPQSSHFSELGLHDYGKVWRCWTARPTDEQREAVKWDE